MANEIQRKKLSSSIMKNAIKIGNKTLAWIPVELLNIQPYQRKRQKHITKIAENWDDSKCNVLLVSYAENRGHFNVVDGQHRAAAARMRGVEYLVCEIFVGLTLSKEAALFVDQNVDTKKLTPFDTYRANQFIDGEEITELSVLDKRISEVCKVYNINVEKSNAGKTLRSVTVARSIIKRDGETGLQFVFDVIQDSHWDEFKDGYSGDLMAALGKVYFNNKNRIEDVKRCLCGFLVNSTPDELNAISNNTYPNLTRRARLDKVLADIIADPSANTEKKTIVKIA